MMFGTFAIFEAARNGDVMDLRYIAVQYLYIALNIDFAL